MTGKIPVVDDEIGTLKLISILLERGGFAVLKAQSAGEALEYQKTTTPDLIVLDVIMSLVDGIEFCRQLRAAPETATIPVLILSARGDVETVKQAVKAGADDYLTKPILCYDLITKVRAMLAGENIFHPPYQEAIDSLTSSD